MRYTVLVVDDEKIIAKNIAKLIEQMNPAFQVIAICTNGEDAIEYIKSGNINVVFTDIRMPEPDGLELARLIFEKHPYIECVIVSGYNDFEYAKSAIDYRVKNYLLKPISKEELGKCLSTIERSLNASLFNLANVSLQDKKGKKPEEIVALIKAYIQNNYQNIIDLSIISENLGFSASYLTKIFMKYEGMTPSKYLKQYRILIAKQLLRSTDIPISVISAQTGFGDQFHFSKTFKSVMGSSPTQYRNQTDNSYQGLPK